MKPVLIFRHIQCEGPGYLADFLNRHEIPFNIVRVDDGANVPDSIDSLSGLVFMGGPMSVNDNLSWIPPELELIRSAQAAELPVLGHCLGAQLISKALGGVITTNPVKEIGWHPVDNVTGKSNSKWLDGLPLTFEAFHMHGEIFSIPENATLLLSNKYCAHQAFSMGNTLALQFHVEITRTLLDEWLTIYREDINQASDGIQNRELILDNVGEKIRQIQSIADKIYTQWIKRLDYR